MVPDSFAVLVHDVTDTPSTVVKVLVRAANEAAKANRRLVVQYPQAIVRRVLDLTGASNILEVR